MPGPIYRLPASTPVPAYRQMIRWFRPGPECLEGRDVDVVELDASDNNGPQNIRDIVDSLKYLPSVGAHRFLVIRNPEMATEGVRNAILKTMEYVPDHVHLMLLTDSRDW